MVMVFIGTDTWCTFAVTDYDSDGHTEMCEFGGKLDQIHTHHR